MPVIDAARGIFGVIDGIGGQAGGEVAAATARDVILQRLARQVGTPAERVREAIAIANNEIYRRAATSAELAGMGCVVTLAIVNDGRLTIGHVGDTRLYKIRPEEIRKITRDHSPVGEREDAGELPEPEAMRHPRRHEVFRDVGTIYRDKDEQEFVDVIEEPLEPDSAILISSDGLTDMLPGATIAHIVHQHAGAPQRVVEALVAAANDAGGRDNVTVVYAEMPLFAERMGHGHAADTLTSTEALVAQAEAVPAVAVPAVAARPGPVRRAVRAIVRSRATWFAVGTLGGVVGALALTAYVATKQAQAPRTLAVAADGSAAFSTIMGALAEGRPGDIVRVEPGVYREPVVVRDGVDLIARVPGTVTIVHPREATTPVATIAGAFNVRITGIRFDAETPVDAGIRIAAPAATLDLVEITGQIKRAIDLAAASSLTVRGSRIAVAGTVLALPDDAHATFVNSVIVHGGSTTEDAISATAAPNLVLRGNVFAGYGAEVIQGVAPARRSELMAGNLVIPGEPQAPGPPAGSSARPRGSR
jgi:serine/threonine protein phosphatase PrpC